MPQEFAGTQQLLQNRHREELKLSGISDAVIEKNFWTIDDPQEFDRLLDRNTKRRWKHSDNLVPGWAVAGVDPSTGERLYKGAQYKPDTPREVDGRVCKYESIAGAEASPLFLAGGVDWANVLADKSVSIADGEGAKKAAALLSLGQAAIAHSGVTTGQKQGRLRKEIKEIYVPERNVYLVYDADWQLNANVAMAIMQQGRLIKAQGAMVYVVVWDVAKGKGIDDYLMTFPERERAEEWERLKKVALTYEEWRTQAKDVVELSLKQKAIESREVAYNVTTTSDDWLFTEIFPEGEYVVIDDNFYRWGGKTWLKIGDKEIKRQIAFALRKAYSVDKKGNTEHKFATDARVKSGFGFLQTILDVGKDFGVQHLINFNNGVLDLATMQLLPHNPLFYLTTQIDSDYTPGLPCPEVFEQFLESSYGAELIPVIRAAIAMLINPLAPWGKFIHLLGESGSGKGVLLRVIQSLFGTQHARSGTTFGELMTPEQRHQNLSSVMLYCLPDIAGYQSGLQAFYELCDNGQLSGRALYSASGYQKQWSVRFAIGSVAPLQVENVKDGWDRRALIIPTKGAIAAADKDPYLEKKLTTPETKAGIISWALAMDRDERDLILRLPELASDRIARMQYEASLVGDPIRAFVDHCLRPSLTPANPKVRTEHLHSLFCAYAEAFGYSKVGEKKFASHLKTIIGSFHQERRKARIGQGEMPDGAGNMMTAGWGNIDYVADLFSYNNGQGKWEINKAKAQEGGLYEFAEFIPGQGVSDKPKASLGTLVVEAQALRQLAEQPPVPTIPPAPETNGHHRAPEGESQVLLSTVGAKASVAVLEQTQTAAATRADISASLRSTAISTEEVEEFSEGDRVMLISSKLDIDSTLTAISDGIPFGQSAVVVGFRQHEQRREIEIRLADGQTLWVFARLLKLESP